ncbi:protein MRG2-like [Apium graveolens]|uniref:protein MRG2-like n=1 Tax=Apium graveolens TaxID=4045 RepID=UPI003D7BBE5F
MGRSNSGVSGDSLTNSLILKVRKVEYEKQIEAWTYWGWNKRYDEWILDAQLLKKFSENVLKSTWGSVVDQLCQLNAISIFVIYQEDPLIMEENKLSIEIPQALKTQLLNDREYVTNSSKLVDIFFKQRLRETIPEILKGLCNYFNKALSTKLLYKTELQQYDEVRAKNIQPSTIYGAEHFFASFWYYNCLQRL